MGNKRGLATKQRTKVMISLVAICAMWVFFGIEGLLGEGTYPHEEGKVYVHILDVGQGDSVFIHTPEGNNIMIDGGPNANVLDPLGRLLGFGNFTIDMMFLTHPHADHLSGLIDIIERMTVREVWYTGVTHTTPTFKEWLRQIKKHDIPMHQIDTPQTLERDGLTFEILYPDADIRKKDQWVEDNAGLNDTSIVMRMTFKNTSFLFMGDAEKALETHLLEKSDKLKADVLKVGHHGSRTSTHLEFLNAVDPIFAVISAGEDNEYGHPHTSTINRIIKKGIQLLRTDINGTITFISDGQTINFHTER